MRLIDADAAKKAVHEEFDECLVWDESGEHTANVIEEILEALPTVDAEPVRHGKWFIGTVPYFACSECKNRTPLRWDERCGYVLDYRSPYCPNCGAKMDAERKDNETD